MYKKKIIIACCLVFWLTAGCSVCKNNARQTNSVLQRNAPDKVPVAVIKVYDNTGQLVE